MIAERAKDEVELGPTMFNHMAEYISPAMIVNDFVEYHSRRPPLASMARWPRRVRLNSRGRLAPRPPT
jgi:hypothetical protein